MQTAVEYLVSKIASKIDNEYWSNQQDITEYVEQAKQMEKRDIISGYSFGHNDGCRYMNNEKQEFEHGEAYFAEIYVSNGNDNSPKEENKYSFGEVSAYSPTQENKPLAYHTIEAYPKIEITEISDEKIFNKATDKYVIEDEIEAFFQGAKWYRELKNKP